MDVTPAKQHQFTSVIRVPGHKISEEWIDNQRKPLYKENSEHWKTHQRLSSPHIESIGNRKFNCNLVPASVHYPDRDGMKCMCYENLMRIIKDRAFIQPQVIYRIPSRQPPRVTLDSVRPTWMKKAMVDYRGNQQLQFPLATVVVRWQQKRTLLNYDKSTLRSLFKRYGEVVDIRMLTPNSCIVIFGEIQVACQVVESKNLGVPFNKLHCSWWHRSMANKSVVIRAKGVSLKTDVFLL